MHRFHFHSEHSTIIIDPKSWDLFRYWNTPLIIIEFRCKWQRPTKTDTENFIDRYRILYIFFNCFLFDFLLNIHVQSIAYQAKARTRFVGPVFDFPVSYNYRT
jgi:hypothetical protein